MAEPENKTSELKLNQTSEEIKKNLENKTVKSEKRGRKSSAYMKKKELEEKQMQDELIAKESGELIPAVCTIYNDFCDSRIEDQEILNVAKLKQSEIQSLTKNFVPVAIKYGWSFAGNVPEVMLAITTLNIAVPRILFIRKYNQHLPESEPDKKDQKENDS